jgi:thioesterase domain-containing protein
MHIEGHAGRTQSARGSDRAIRWSDPLREDHLAADAPSPQVSGDSDEKLAVFLLPGLSGDMGELAALLSPTEAPLHFVPLRYRHWSALRPEPDELDRLVADCVRQIESHGPRGTILLAGYSFGGVLAWPLAKAMATAGHQIGLLALIDAHAHPKIENSAESVVGRFGRFARGICRGETGHQMARSSAGIMFRSRGTWVRATFRRLHGFGLLPRIFNCIDANIQIRYHMVLLKECMARMAADGERLLYPSVLFKRSTRPLAEKADLGWTRHLANLRIVTLSGDHASVLQTQNVGQIIGHLTEIISRHEGILPVATSHLSVNQGSRSLSKVQAIRT